MGQENVDGGISTPHSHPTCRKCVSYYTTLSSTGISSFEELDAHLQGVSERLDANHQLASEQLNAHHRLASESIATSRALIRKFVAMDRDRKRIRTQQLSAARNFIQLFGANGEDV